MNSFNCQNCDKLNPYKKNTANKFCNNTCSAEFKWKNDTIPRILNGDVTHNSSKALKRYLRESRGDQCEICKQGNVWNGKPLVLQLDHIDGNSDNNALDNLRLICPNCHTQTSTFASKGKGSRYKKVSERNQYLQEYKSSGR